MYPYRLSVHKAKPLARLILFLTLYNEEKNIV
jgi:hypothetical protein